MLTESLLGAGPVLCRGGGCSSVKAPQGAALSCLVLLDPRCAGEKAESTEGTVLAQSHSARERRSQGLNPYSSGSTASARFGMNE